MHHPRSPWRRSLDPCSACLSGAVSDSGGKEDACCLPKLLPCLSRRFSPGQHGGTTSGGLERTSLLIQSVCLCFHLQQACQKRAWPGNLSPPRGSSPLCFPSCLSLLQRLGARLRQVRFSPHLLLQRAARSQARSGLLHLVQPCPCVPRGARGGHVAAPSRGSCLLGWHKPLPGGSLLAALLQGLTSKHVSSPASPSHEVDPAKCPVVSCPTPIPAHLQLRRTQGCSM